MRADLQVLLQRGDIARADAQQRVGGVHGRGERLIGRQDVHKRLRRAATCSRFLLRQGEGRPRMQSVNNTRKHDACKCAQQTLL